MSREGILKTSGHGILYAGAAIGASHLVFPSALQIPKSKVFNK